MEGTPNNDIRFDLEAPISDEMLEMLLKIGGDGPTTKQWSQIFALLSQRIRPLFDKFTAPRLKSLKCLQSKRRGDDRSEIPRAELLSLDQTGFDCDPQCVVISEDLNSAKADGLNTQGLFALVDGFRRVPGGGCLSQRGYFGIMPDGLWIMGIVQMQTTLEGKQRATAFEISITNDIHDIFLFFEEVYEKDPLHLYGCISEAMVEWYSSMVDFAVARLKRPKEVASALRGDFAVLNKLCKNPPPQDGAVVKVI
ncbi:MAG: hypothetical protein PHU42_03460 [Patescibacteria group bacterium]|nr:hypothetical protein [Patescibacteria group bacterium]